MENQIIEINGRGRFVAGIICTALLSLVLVASAAFKLTLDPTSVKGQEMLQIVGDWLMRPLAFTELALVVLLWVPRTAAIGYVLTFGYWSGAIATHLTQDMPVTVQPLLAALTLLAASWRTPELFIRLLGSQEQNLCSKTSTR